MPADSPIDVLTCRLLQQSPDTLRHYVQRLLESQHIDLELENARLDVARADAILRGMHYATLSVEHELAQLAVPDGARVSHRRLARITELQVSWAECQVALRRATEAQRGLWDTFMQILLSRTRGGTV
jgi:hypothetical protein